MKTILPKSPVAFFSAEYALRSDAPTYAGGLGVLTGDYILEAAKENFPFILLSLRYGSFDAAGDGYELAEDPTGKPLVFSIPIERRDVFVRAWVKNFGVSAAAILFDTDLPENSSEDRSISSVLYDSHLYTRIRQQLVLGLSGAECLARLGVSPRIYHLNEGHTSIAALGIVAQEMKGGRSFTAALESCRAKVVFTKHTIFSEAGLYIPSNEFFEFISKFCVDHMIAPKDVFEIGKYEKDEDMFSTTKFGVRMSCRRNAVSALHAVKEKEVHPSSEFISVTNGVFKDRWDFLPYPPASTDTAIWDMKRAAKMRALDFIKGKTGVALDPEAFTVVWARRFAAYKRPRLLFTDLARLAKIASHRNHPVQFVISGKAHPSDEEGQKTVEMIRGIAASVEFRGRIAYVPDYSLEVTANLVSAADLWVNTPERGKEACGTSGMKAALSGALMCSISDGWMDEVDWKGVGWILPEDKTAEALYGLLEGDITESFYRRGVDGTPLDWISRVKKTRSIVETQFCADRMLRDYAREMYGFDA
jgi:starch phosphorylase